MDILNKYSDDEHPLSTPTIINKLRDNGLECERKSVYKSIETLINYGMDINKSYKPKRGFYVGERAFELAEIRLLIDAVLSAHFITAKKTKELVNKLKGQLSNYQAASLERQIHIDKTVKIDNEEIFYYIDKINRAICTDSKISFTYYHRIIKDHKIQKDEGKKFKLSPYALLWSNERYYVAGNCEKYNTVANYRLDRMEQVEILDECSRPCSEVTYYTDGFDVADYVKKSVDMFSGEPSDIELICENSFFETLIDKFGTNIKFKNSSSKQFSAKIHVYISDGLVDWLVKNADKVYVNYPCSLRTRVKDKIKTVHNTYFRQDSNGYLI